MEESIWLPLLIILCCFALSAFFSGSETALTAASRARMMALELAKHRIRVNTVSPGAVETARLTGRFGSMEKARQLLAPLHPIGRLAQPEEIAAAHTFLASQEASYITGQVIFVDGGVSVGA